MNWWVIDMAGQDLILVPANDSDASRWSVEALSTALDLGNFEINNDHGIIEIKVKNIETSNNSIKYDINKELIRLEEKFGVKFILVKRVIDAEKGYVRRTAEQFAAGAEPVRGGGSHRMTNVGLPLTYELREVTKATAEAMGVKYTNWMRAALRKALREGVDVEKELSTPIEVEVPEPEPSREK